MSDPVDHPAYYGGDEPCEHHKVVQAWGLNYYLGNCTKYICRVGRKPGANAVQDLKKARWYLNQEIAARWNAENPEPACSCSQSDYGDGHHAKGCAKRDHWERRDREL